MRNRTKTATPAVQAFVEGEAEKVDIPYEAGATIDDEPQGETEQDTFDDSWLEELTPYETAQTTQPAQTQPQQEADDGTAEQQKNLRELYQSFETTDEEVVAELDSKLFAPLRNEVRELREQREQELKYRQDQLRAKSNAVITAKYKNAEVILKSQQFKDFVNADDDPYSTEQKFDRVARAYHSGDGEYVLRMIDAFVASRGKPKPPVGVEPQGSGGSGVTSTRGKRTMTDAEYLAKRQAIKSAPRGTYPPNALKNLVDEYNKNRG